MKTIASLILLITLVIGCSTRKPEEKARPADTAAPAKPDDAVEILPQTDEDTLKGSLRAKVSGRIGEAILTIRYHSPAVRGRIVWGGLVPFDRVWVTGAHMATSIEVDRPLIIAGTSVPAGKYALFTIPGRDAWTVILNKNWEQHLTDEYDAKDDVLRVIVAPEQETTHQERLRYMIEEEGDSKGEVVMYWEKLEISLPLEVAK